MTQVLAAIATALIVILFRIVLSKYFTSEMFAATILCSVAFIYVGFSLKGNPVSSILLEVLVSVIFYFIAITGYSRSNMLIAYGIVLHGLWDILHYKGWLVKTEIPDYWPVYCIVADLIFGLHFFISFKMNTSRKRLRLLNKNIR